MIDTYVAGASLQDVGSVYGITRERVRQILKRAGVTERHHGIGTERRVLVRERRLKQAEVRKQKLAARQALHAEVRRLYDAGLPYAAIRDKLGISNLGTVQEYVNATGGVSRRKPGVKPKHNLSLAMKKDIAMRYAGFEPVSTIAADYGVSNPYVSQIAIKLGYKRGSGPGVMEQFKRGIGKRGIGLKQPKRSEK